MNQPASKIEIDCLIAKLQSNENIVKYYKSKYSILNKDIKFGIQQSMTLLGDWFTILEIYSDDIFINIIIEFEDLKSMSKCEDIKLFFKKQELKLKIKKIK